MNKWIRRATIVVLVAGTVAAILPGIKQRLSATSRPPGSIGLLQMPDQGSLLVAAVVAIALLRVFVTLDRRSRSPHP